MVSAEATGTLECGLCHTAAPPPRQGTSICAAVSVSHCPRPASGWGATFLGLMAVLQGRGYLSSQHLHLKQLKMSAPAQERRSGQSLHPTHDSQVMSPPLCLPSTPSPVCPHQHPQNVISATPQFCDLKQVAQACLACKTDGHTSCRVPFKIMFSDSPERPALLAFIRCQSPLPSCCWPPVFLLSPGRWQLQTDAC